MANGLSSTRPNTSTTSKPARVLAVGETDELATCLSTVHSHRDMEITGVARVDAGVPDVVEALRPDIAVICCDADSSDVREALRRMRDHGNHQCDVLLILNRPHPDLILDVVRLGVFSCLVAPVEPRVLRCVLEAWLNRRNLTEPAAPDSGDERPLPNNSTIALVAMVLRESHRPLSASEVGRLCNLSSVASRRYLKQLVDQGAAVLTMEYGRTGRPRHMFGWATRQARSNITPT